MSIRMDVGSRTKRRYYRESIFKELGKQMDDGLIGMDEANIVSNVLESSLRYDIMMHKLGWFGRILWKIVGY